MPHKLLIRLKNIPAQPPAMEWLVLFANGKSQLFTETDSNEKLLKYAEMAEQIIVLVPSIDVFITQVRLPRLALVRFVKAISFALEDQITEDPANLHFAASQRQGSEPISVAVVAKQTMEFWLSMIAEKLQQAAQKVKLFLPDVLALPWQSGYFYILIDQDIAWVRTGKCSGFAIEAKALFQVLMLLLNRPELTKPTLIQIDQTEMISLFSEEEIAKLGVPIQISSTDKKPITLMSNVLQEPAKFNLLQGDYATTRNKVTFDRLIGTGFAIICAWMMVVTFADIVNYLILNQVKTSIYNEMKLIYAQIHPNTQAPENPKASLQKELNNLRDNRSASEFIQLLNSVEPTFYSLVASGLSLKSITYRSNQLILNIEASDSTIINKFRLALEQQGLKVAESNALLSKSGLITTRFTIEELH